jgi:hypothetical protein
VASLPKSDEQTAAQLRAELAAERAALAAAVAEARDELKRSATLATSASFALGSVTFVAKRLFARRRGS